MQQSILIAAIAAVVVLGTTIAAPPARAVEAAFPYCATPTWSEGLDCDYQSLQQCVAAVAGFNRTCVANPAFASSPPTLRASR